MVSEAMQKGFSETSRDLDGLRPLRTARLGLRTRSRRDGLPSMSLLRLRCHSFLTISEGLLLPALAPSTSSSARSIFSSGSHSLPESNRPEGRMLTKLLGERDMAEVALLELRLGLGLKASLAHSLSPFVSTDVPRLRLRLPRLCVRAAEACFTPTQLRANGVLTRSRSARARFQSLTRR